MSNLDRSWILLIAFGIFFFIFTVGWDIYQSVSGSNSEFSLPVVKINDDTLVTDQLIEHFQNGADYRTYEPSLIEE
ncbi:MAG: hypothetical protein Q9M91_02070 [Candidatus Dojkabacteria bacterium]|nr:hypothetical protein [Candidatus Dojkabacteria bacterium]MDQ7020610.1 hypothetical protein [Candidatus Dojkabacteria bacterium]